MKSHVLHKSYDRKKPICIHRRNNSPSPPPPPPPHQPLSGHFGKVPLPPGVNNSPELSGSPCVCSTGIQDMTTLDVPLKGVWFHRNCVSKWRQRRSRRKLLAQSDFFQTSIGVRYWSVYMEKLKIKKWGSPRGVGRRCDTTEKTRFKFRKRKDLNFLVKDDYSSANESVQDPVKLSKLLKASVTTRRSGKPYF